MIPALEIRRQAFHILYGAALLVLIHFDIFSSFQLFLLVLVGLVLSQVAKKETIPIISPFLSVFSREDEMKTFPGKGMIYYTLGAFFVVILFSKDIALASIIILALGDAASRLIGPFGKIRHPFHNIKFVEGALAGMVIAFLGALLFVHPIEALVASAVAMIIEGFDLKIGAFKLDDNFIIPVIAGAAIWLLRFSF